MPSIQDFAVWEPLLRLLQAGNPQILAPGGQVGGWIGRGGWSVPLPRTVPPRGRAMQAEDRQDESDAVERIRSALADDGIDQISYVVETSPTGGTVLHLLTYGPAVEAGLGPYPGSLLLVEGAVPEPWRRLPEPRRGAVPARSADPALLERTLRADPRRCRRHRGRRLPRAWDHPDPVSATVMGPPGCQ